MSTKTHTVLFTCIIILSLLLAACGRRDKDADIVIVTATSQTSSTEGGATAAPAGTIFLNAGSKAMRRGIFIMVSFSVCCTPSPLGLQTSDQQPILDWCSPDEKLLPAAEAQRLRIPTRRPWSPPAQPPSLDLPTARTAYRRKWYHFRGTPSMMKTSAISHRERV